MAGKTARKTSAKAASAAAGKRGAAKVAKPRGTTAKSRVREAEAALRWQPADREGIRRRAGAGLHRGDAGWKREVGRQLDALIVRAGCRDEPRR